MLQSRPPRGKGVAEPFREARFPHSSDSLVREVPSSVPQAGNPRAERRSREDRALVAFVIMEAIVTPDMSRSYQRRSAAERLADLEKKISSLKAKQVSREKKDDPVLREVQKLQKRLKQFIQTAHDHKRPDIANGAMGFKAMLDRIVGAELGALAEETGRDEGDEEA